VRARSWLFGFPSPRPLVALFTMLTTASAQYAPLPVTVQLHNKATKEPIGTATFSDNRIYFRDKNGEHYATIEIAPDGTRTTYDPSGKVIAAPSRPK
jgi:hypothetical protein